MVESAHRVKQVLEHFSPNLEDVKYDKLKGKLRRESGGFLSDHEWVSVKQKMDNGEHMRRLTEMLKSKPKEDIVFDFKIFCTILENSGYGDLASKMEKKAGLPSQAKKRASKSQGPDQKGRSNHDRPRESSSVPPKTTDNNAELELDTEDTIQFQLGGQPQVNVIDNHQSSTFFGKLVDSISELQKVVQEEGTAKVGISLHFTFGNETDVPLDSKVLGTSPRSNQHDSTDGSFSNGYGSPPNTSTPKRGDSRDSSRYSPNISATEKCVSEFLKQYKDLMLDRIVAREIAVKLFDKCILPESVVSSIRNADSEYNANSILWSHASKHYEFQSCLTLCAVMERENGYPKMTILGTRMREELEKYKDEYIACDNRMMDPF